MHKDPRPFLLPDFSIHYLKGKEDVTNLEIYQHMTPTKQRGDVDKMSLDPGVAELLQLRWENLLRKCGEEKSSQQFGRWYFSQMRQFIYLYIFFGQHQSAVGWKSNMTSSWTHQPHGRAWWWWWSCGNMPHCRFFISSVKHFGKSVWFYSRFEIIHYIKLLFY